MPVEIGLFKSNLESAQIRTNPHAEMTCKHATRPRQSLFLSRPRCQLLDARREKETKIKYCRSQDGRLRASAQSAAPSNSFVCVFRVELPCLR